MDIKLTKETKDLWRDDYHRPLKDEEIRLMIANVSGFFDTLSEWERIAKLKQDNEKQGINR